MNQLQIKTLHYITELIRCIIIIIMMRRVSGRQGQTLRSRLGPVRPTEKPVAERLLIYFPAQNTKAALMSSLKVILTLQYHT